MKKKKNKKVWNILLLITMTILVLYIVLKDNFNAIVAELGQANLWWIAAAVIVFYLSILVKSISFHKIVNEFDKKFSLYDSMRMQLGIQFFNGVTPFSTGGQPFEVVWLNKYNIDTPSSMNIVIQDFITYQTALVLLGVYAILFNFFGHMFPANSILKNLVTIGFFMNTLVIVLLYVITFNPKFNKKITGWVIGFLNKFKLVKDKEATIQKWEEYIDQFSKSAHSLTNNWHLFIKTILLNILTLCLLYSVPLFIALSLNAASFSLNECIIASAYAMLIGAFVPIPGATGGIEYAFSQFFGNFITNGAVLSAILLLWRAITYYSAMIVGAIALYAKRRAK